MQMKISVILPVYNVEGYLAECLDSLLGQTLQDIEIICVNDCSIDDSLLILTGYADSDPRMKIINQRKNQGLSAVRNRGLKEATGEYVYFLDSDDYLADINALERMYKASIIDDIDILSFNHRTIGMEEKEYIRDMENNAVLNGKTYLRHSKMGGVMVWLRLYRREYLESLDFKFTPGILAEDDEALPRIYYDAKKVKHIEDILLVYRRRDGSNTTIAVSAQLIDGLIAVVKTYLTLCKREDGAGLNKHLYNKALEYLFVLYEKIFYVDDRATALEKYECLIKSADFTPFEERLIKNEEKFIVYARIEKKKKKYKPLVYYTRRFRIYYFNNRRKYGV
jgi:glycosyltransferase involved in cell wall biosynthesis